MRNICKITDCCFHCLVAKSCLTLLLLHELYPTSLIYSWDFQGKNTGMGCYFLLQGIFMTQGSNLHLLHFLHWQVYSLPLSHQGVQFSHSVMFNSVIKWTAAHLASLIITNSQSLLKLKSIKSMRPSNHLILCCPLLLLPSIFASIRVYSNEPALHIRWPKYWSFSFNISPSNGYLGLISLRMDWLDLLAVQGTLKSLLQHHSSKASILWCSAFLQSNSHLKFSCFVCYPADVGNLISGSSAFC